MLGDKTKTEHIVIVVMCVGLLLFLGVGMIKKISSKKLIQQKKVLVEKTQSEEQELHFLGAAWKSLEWGMNPFRARRKVALDDSIPQEVKWDDWKLTGILWSENNAVAIINDDIIHEGDMINKFRVLQILKDRVIIEAGEETIELHLKGESL